MTATGAGVGRSRIRAPSYGLVVCGSLLTFPLLVAVHIAVGSVDISTGDVLRVLAGNADSRTDEAIVLNLRLPRALVAALAGLMLGLAGALLQSITRNPLAAPGLLGVTGGAVLAIVLYITNFVPVSFADDTASAGLSVPAVGMIGGLAAGAVVYVLSRSGSGGVDPMRLILVGVVVGGVLASATGLVLVRGSDENTRQIVQWTVGSTGGRVWSHFNTLLPVAAITVPLTIASIGWANALQLGDDAARGLGMRVNRTRFVLLALSAALTSGAVSVVGAVGFVGLIGPHTARLLVGSDLRRLFPLSGLLGGLLLLAADIAARGLTLGFLADSLTDDESVTGSLPVGATTAFLGAPFMLYLIVRRRTHT